jgi:ArsR family transcriptional regulator
VQVRREGTASYYSASLDELPTEVEAVWKALSAHLEDPLLESDRARASALVVSRDTDASWSASIAGRMERYYSPGRTWQSSARAFLGLGRLGRVLDIASGDGALAELIAPRAEALTCVDVSAKVVAAGARRLARFPQARFLEADMHALPFEDASFDQVLLLNAMTYATQPEQVVTEAARVLRPGGALIGATLAAHKHVQAVAPYGHQQLGFDPAQLRSWLEAAGLGVDLCEVTHTERRAPHFEVITLHAEKTGA